MNNENFKINSTLKQKKLRTAGFKDYFRFRNPENDVTNFHDFVSIIFIYVALFFIFPIILSAIIQATGNKTLIESDQYSLWVQFSIELVSIILFFIFTRKNLRTFFIKLKDYKTYLFPILIGLSLGGLSILYSYILQWGGLQPGANEQKVDQLIRSMPALAFFTMVLIGPLFEEFVFRTGFYSFISNMNKFLALIISSLIFAFLHLSFGKDSNIAFEFASLPFYLISGVVLALTYEKFGLTGSVIVHLINNLISYTFVLVVR